MQDSENLTRLKNVGESLALLFLALAVCVVVVVSKAGSSVGRLFGYRKPKSERSGAMDEYVRSLHESHAKSRSAARLEPLMEESQEPDQVPTPSADRPKAPTSHYSAEDAHSRD